MGVRRFAFDSRVWQRLPIRTHLRGFDASGGGRYFEAETGAMAAATYDQRPAFLRKELEKILREKGRHGNALRVERAIPDVRVTTEGDVKVVTPSVAANGRR